MSIRCLAVASGVAAALVGASPAWSAPGAARVARAQPAPAAPLAVPPIAYTHRTLANGLEVIAALDRSSPTVSVQVWYRVGSKDDPPGRSGFAHLFEHLMFKSTRYLKNEQYDRLTEDVGGMNNAFTDADMTGYHAVVPSNHLETLLWAEAERMSNLKVDEANFKSERGVVQEEYRQRVLASPYGRFFNGIAPSTYQVHPYKRLGIGSIEDLDAATLDDVIAFHRQHYRPDNAVLVVGGDFDPAQLQAWVDKYFAIVPRPATPIPRVTVEEPPWPAERSVRLTGPNVPLPAVAIAWLGPSVTHADAAALNVASALLGAGESSRLNQSLVYRRQVATQAGFEAERRTGPGLLVGYAIAAGGRSTETVATALQAEVRRLVDAPPTVAEIDKVKTQLLTAALASRQTPLGRASALADAAILYRDPGYANQMLDDLQRVTPGDVQRVVRQHLLGGRRVTITYVQGDDKKGAAR